MKGRNWILGLVIVLIVGVIYWLERPVATLEAVTDDAGVTVQLGALPDQIFGVGEVAPDFVLQDYEENVVRLSDFRGQKVMLNFWASWCPFCVDEMPLFETIYNDLEGQGFELLAVNRGESAEEARAFSDNLSLTYPLLVNEADDVSKAYNLRGMPSTYFIDEGGVLTGIKIGPIEEVELRERLKEYLDLVKLSSEALVSDVIMPEPTDAVVDTTPEDPENALQFSDVPVSSRTVMETDGVKHSIPLEDIESGGPRKDGIPPIDDPKFTSVAEGSEFLDDEGLGIAVSFNGVDRFYPFQILVYHEIVNDNVNGRRALVTYCPLCGTGIVFDPTVQGGVDTFGTSGKLWNSNLLMYDRRTDTYWSQVLGEAVKGKLTGAKLRLLSYDNMRWGDWKTAHPEGEVLSKDTGHTRNYAGSGPYGSYDTDKRIIFDVGHEDDRYHPKEPTFGIEVDGHYRVYPQSELQRSLAEFMDEVAGVILKIDFDSSNNTLDIRRMDTDEEVVPFYGFWFSWIAVHPKTEVYSADEWE
jgi:peroxiredoxin